MQFFIEPRFNIPGSPFDVGMQGMIGSFYRDENIYGVDQNVRHRGLVVTFADYNFRYWKRVAPFAGLGVGFSAVNNEWSWINSDGRRSSDMIYDRSFILNPRIGVEFFNHLRVTLEYKLMKKEYSFFGMNVGFAFGGGYKPED